MTAVASETRAPWADEPKCQSCHTGDALDNFGGEIVRYSAYADSPDVATPIVATNTRFAEQPDKLFRNSTGHGGVSCEGCHGSTHAIWPSREPNDNRAAIAIQKHDGVIIECGACHGTTALALDAGRTARTPQRERPELDRQAPRFLRAATGRAARPATG